MKKNPGHEQHRKDLKILEVGEKKKKIRVDTMITKKGEYEN